MSLLLRTASRNMLRSTTRLSPLIALITNIGPSPSANALVNASIRPSGFLRFITLMKSNANKNMYRSSRPKRDRAIEASTWGVTTGSGTYFTCTRDGACLRNIVSINRVGAHNSSTCANAGPNHEGASSSSQNHCPITYRSVKKSAPSLSLAAFK